MHEHLNYIASLCPSAKFISALHEKPILLWVVIATLEELSA